MITPKEWGNLPQAKAEQLAGLLKFLPQEDIQIRKAKKLLVNGFDCELVAKLTKIPLEKIRKFYSESWNPRSRHPTQPQSQNWRNRNLSVQWKAGKTCSQLCEYFKLPLYTIIRILDELDVPADEIKSRLPEKSDPLYIEYRKLVKIRKARKAKLEKRRLRTIQKQIDREAKRIDRENTPTKKELMMAEQAERVKKRKAQKQEEIKQQLQGL